MDTGLCGDPNVAVTKDKSICAVFHSASSSSPAATPRNRLTPRPLVWDEAERTPAPLFLPAGAAGVKRYSARVGAPGWQSAQRFRQDPHSQEKGQALDVTPDIPSRDWYH